LSVLIWTEDSADHADEAIAALARKMLTLVVAGCQTQRIAFEPLNDAAARALKGSAWKGAAGRERQRLVDLRQAIATKLVEGTGDVPGFVFFHVDGDTAWADRARAENPAKFAAFTVAIEPLVSGALERRGRSAELGAIMSRLCVLMPFHSIEAWLFQNTDELARRCQASCGRHFGLIQKWAADRGQLDELAGDEQPKKLLTCIRTADHVALASQGYPANAVFDVDKSYAAAVLGLLACDALGAALARTHA
jgi:hypothetical protein